MWKFKQDTNNQWGKKETTRWIRKYFNMNENEDTIYQNTSSAMEVVLREKFITRNPYI